MHKTVHYKQPPEEITILCNEPFSSIHQSYHAMMMGYPITMWP